MDYVYICRKGENEELRYSLRSIEKNMPEGRVWVFGYRPDWYIGDFIKVDDVGSKFENIRNCISVVAKDKNISENFILMNDDFFALKKINVLENFHGGLLENKIIKYKESKMSPKYIKLLELTMRQLQKSGITNPIDYDIHVPMIMNKIILNKAIDIAFFPRSAYGNLAKINGKKITDVKIYTKEKIKLDILKYDNSFISTEDNSFLILKNNILEKLFFECSKFENPNYVVGNNYVKL